MVRVLQRHASVDDTALDHVEQRLVHGLHTLGGAGGDNGVDLVGLLLADQVADGRVHDHDLEHRRGAAVDGGYQALRDRCL